MSSFEVKYLEGSRGQVTFRYRPAEVTVEALVKAVEKSNTGYRVTVGDPKTVPPPTGDIDFRILSTGAAFEIEPALAKGKITIVFFMMDGHLPSTLLGVKIDTLAQKYKGVAVRQVNLGRADGSDAAARQVKRDFGVSEAPYVRVYGRDGKFLREVKGNKPDEIEACLK